MEPLKPDQKRAIFQASPSATPEDIAEYEKLLAERFTVDPDLPRDPASRQLLERKNERLKQLRKKLFPEAESESEGEGTAALG
jgi:hypothetical protein